ncbi:acetoin utilization protein AcuC [Catenulispora yoronensis]|uniref:acetoin utilization protein AcuC n=1 Tax=Catenulispora yoronensis TaxID=450799 RepID=UPI0031D7B557
MPWDDAVLNYDFGPSHPLAPVRVELTMALARALGVLDHSDVRIVPVTAATDAELRLVHAPEYIDAVRAADDASTAQRQTIGIGTADNPHFPRMHEPSALIAGASIAAAREVWTGAAAHAVNIAGGLHHAMRSQAAGFCIYNDPAIAIAWLLAQGARRVAYVDVDVHHGDGVQAAFWNDPRVLTISLHQDPRTLFPGTGHPGEAGGPDAEGYAVNVALPPATTDEPWLRAFDAVVPPLLAAFGPDVLLSQHGCDTHTADPLADLHLTVDGQRAVVERLHRLAHEHAAGKWVATGGGGYALVDVVPRIWTHLLAEAAHHPIAPDTPTPEQWRDRVRELTGQHAPITMTDGLTPNPNPKPWSAGYDPGDRVDQAVLATRSAVFPHHGLDPAY